MVLTKWITGIALLLNFSLAVASETYTFKFATLVPPDTAWMKQVRQWADTVKLKSNGRLVFKIYPGGVMGDEPDVLRKIHGRQLQGAFFTGYGIGRIYSPARVLEVPFLFRSRNESGYVRDRMMKEIAAGFEKNGFILLGWPEVGFVHFFSKLPINSLEQLKQRKIWLWQGDPLGEAFASAAGVSPVPLSIVDVYTQLSTNHGSIDTVYNSPFGALAFQWHTHLKYASNIPMTNAIGSLVVSQRFFDRLPADLQQLLRETGAATAERINQISRRDNDKSIQLLKKDGIQFMWNWNDKEKQALIDIRDRAAKILADENYIPATTFQRTTQLLQQYRNQQRKTKPANVH